MSPLLRTLVALCVALVLLGVCRAAHAETRSTFALVVTNNRSSRLSRPDLRYADDDGAKYYEMFRMLAGEGDVALLTTFDDDTKKLFPDLVARASAPTRANLLATAKSFAERIHAARARGPVDFYFVFAGHGDVDHGQGFLEIEDGPFTSDDIQKLVREIPATQSHVILDSCNAFFAIQARKPGGRHFVTSEEAQRSLAAHLPTTGVFLSTSAEGSVFEWSSIQSGIFSHAVRSGLAGGADANGDGHVTYDELQAFVVVATKDVKNPTYRPQVFARGPGGRGGASLFDLTRASGRRLRTDERQQRLTIRDAADVPWFESHQEDGVPTALVVPQRLADGSAERVSSSGARTRVTLPPEENRDVVLLASLPDDTTHGDARGADEIFRSLFARPFGPRAYASFVEEQKGTPPAVFGVSPDERERMRLLLKESADGAKSGRKLLGALFLPLGIGLTTVGVWSAGAVMTEADRLGRSVDAVGATTIGLVLGGGAALTTASFVQLARPSLAERSYTSFTNSLALAPDTHRANLKYAEAEHALFDAAVSERRFRTWSRWVGFGLALNAGFTTGLTLAAVDTRMPTMIPVIFSGLTFIGGALFVGSLFPSATERMAELWKHDPSFTRARTTASFSIAPTLGSNGIGLQGTF